MLGGSTIFMLYLFNRFSKGWARSRLCLVKRCAFQGLSYSGWCLLKSPNHIYCIGVVGDHDGGLAVIYIATCLIELLLLQSL